MADPEVATSTAQNGEDWGELENDILAAPAVAGTSGSERKKKRKKKGLIMTTKTVEGALPVFEMRRESDADFMGSEEMEALRRTSDFAGDDSLDALRRESVVSDTRSYEEPGEDDDFDDGGVDTFGSTTDIHAAAASPTMIAIRGRRSVKRAESEIVVSTSAETDDGNYIDRAADDSVSSPTSGGKVVKKKKREASLTTSGSPSRKSTSGTRRPKKDSASTSDSPLPPEIGSGSSGELPSPILPPTNGSSHTSAATAPLPSPLPAPLPPPLLSASSTGSLPLGSLSGAPKMPLPQPAGQASGAGASMARSNSASNVHPSRSASKGHVPSSSPPPPLSSPPPAPYSAPVTPDQDSGRKSSASGEDDEEPPPMLGAATSTTDILNLSFARRTSLAMDGFSTLRDSMDGSESGSLSGSPNGSRKPLRRRQSSKVPGAGAVTKKKPVRGGASRPKMMDNIIRIVKSMYDDKSGCDGKIFVIEAKEYPENVVYVEEDEEATEDYNVDFPAIKAATVEKLILGLTPEAYADPDFNFAFLLGYKAFTTPQQLVELLQARWTIPMPQKPSKTGVTVDAETFNKKKQIPIRLRIINVIKLWLEEHRQSLDAEARGVIEKFITEVIKPDMAGPAANLLRLVKESTEDKEEQIMFDEKPPKPYLPMNVKAKLSILDIHPEEIARQITLIDSALYRKIKPGEFLHSGWTKSDKEARSPGILAMINGFNIVSRWVSTQILLQTDLKQRAITLNRVICIAQKCLEYNNFNGVMEIIASLHNSSIHRLYNTWEMLPQKSWDMFDSLSMLMNSNAGEGNYYLYRNALKKVVPPLVPYLGVYLTDLIFLNDGNKDFADDAKKMVNFHKMAKIARVVRTITTHQQTPYCLTPVEFIQDFLLKGPLFTDEEQYVESCKLEKKIPKSQRNATQNNKTVKKIKVDFKALNINDD